MGLVYNSVQGLMPKLFEERLGNIINGKIEIIGTIVGLVYGIGAFAQILGGFLADRLPLKKLYICLWLIQIPFMFLLTELAGLPLAFVAAILAISGTSILPAENMMLSEYSSKNNQGFIFGVKFLISFGAAPLGVFLITYTRELTGDFYFLLSALSILTILASFITFFLPKINLKKEFKKFKKQPAF